jgi:hypothetical protein
MTKECKLTVKDSAHGMRPMHYWFFCVVILILSTPVTIVVGETVLFLPLLSWNFNLEKIVIIASVAFAWELALRSVASPQPKEVGYLHKLVKPSSRYWLLPLSCWSLVLLSGLFTRTDTIILDKKKDSIMWRSDTSTGALGTTVVTLNCGRVLLRNIVAITTFSVVVEDIDNHHILGSCHLLSDKLAYVELGGRGFKLDTSTAKTIDGNDLLFGIAK